MKDKALETSANYDIIKSLTIKALFSDDDLLNWLVLKGGNAINLIYAIDSRASIDVDFSIKSHFPKEEMNNLKEKMFRVLKDTFWEQNMVVFDFDFYERPQKPKEGIPTFWGGYRIEFKVIEKKKYEVYKDNIEKLRRNSETFNANHNKTFTVDISKYEYCDTKVAYKFDELKIFVYTPVMIIFEKIRAICQQMPEYLDSIGANKNTASARARDFYDIYVVDNNLKPELFTEDSISVLKNIFDAKKVPLKLLEKISETKNFHEPDFKSVIDTVLKSSTLKEFDFYFNFVVEIVNKLISQLGNIASTP